MVILQLEEQVIHSILGYIKYLPVSLKFQPPIIQAIFAGVIDEVKELIEYKQDVNCLGN